MTEDQAVQRDHLLSDKLYFILSNCVLVIFPSLGTLYFVLAQIWGLPAAQEVLGSIVAVDTFLGVIVKVGETSYKQSESAYDGHVVVTETPEKKTFSLVLNGDPTDLDQQDQIKLKVIPPVETPSQ